MARQMTERHAMRVLRFLARGEARMRPAAGEDRVLLDAGERGVLGVPREVVDALAGDGILTQMKEQVALSEAGRMAARRGTAPSEPFLAQHRELDEVMMATPAGPETVTLNHAESPLALLRRRTGRGGIPFLDAREFAAGERLRADYARGQLVPRLGINWSAAGGGRRGRGEAGGIAELTDAALAARMRVEKAVAAVGPELAGVLIDICCFLKGLEQVESERCWPARTAKVVLKSALGALARHYEPPRPAETRKPAILHWGAQDYRPSIARS